MQSDDYEKMGAFFLGAPVDATSGDRLPGPYLYDSKDLTTHAVMLGMTGSGKTGLAITLIEEALIDGVPVIAIDPKGDLGNLLLTFPDLAPADFRPWVDEGAATRAGQTPDAFAASQAKLWKKGLADWGQSPARIGRLERSAVRTIFTPGSQAGRPLSMLRSMEAPPPALRDDDEAMRERVMASVSGLLGLLGITADPIASREHVLLSNLVDRAWREGRGVDMATLIHQIQKPPIERVGIMDIETFYPANERLALAMRLNNLLASPGFAAWAEGDPLDVAHLLRAPDGRPRLSIVSIAHLGDAERMFVVTRILSELVAWMRTQPGSQSLRALLYMDEIFGYFPPSANPPSKTPMLTLLKQARAYGLGCVLSTQNPVDLDYKGLSNCGTWFLGRLQTERDKARVIDGLESAATGLEGRLDRAELERTLSGLGSRTFLVNNVHEDEPLLVQSRWALSYLAGPLTRSQIQRLVEDDGPGVAAPATPVPPDPLEAPAAKSARAKTDEPAIRAVVPSEASERFVPVSVTLGAGERIVYRPLILASVATHYANARAGVDEWTQRILCAPLPEELSGTPWKTSRLLAALPELEDDPEPDASFEPLPRAAERKKSWSSWSKQAESAVYRDHPLVLFKSKKPKAVSALGEDEGLFRGRVADLQRASREVELEKLRRKYAPKLKRLQEKIDRAIERVDREEQQYKDRKTQTLVSGVATVVGALFGRKLASIGNISRTASTARNVSRTAREKADVGRAEARVEEYQQELAELDEEFREAVAEIEDRAAADEVEIETLRVNARKGDLEVERLHLVWMPMRRTVDGTLERAATLEA